MAAVDELSLRIQEKIGAIPAANPGMISLMDTTLSDVLARELVKQIADVAAEEALKPHVEKTPTP